MSAGGDRRLAQYFLAALTAAALYCPAAASPEGASPTAKAPRAHAPEIEAGEVFRDCPHCPEMVVVPVGTFTMGSPALEMGRRDDEGPVHRVTIELAFAVGVHEATRGEFKHFVSATGNSGGIHGAGSGMAGGGQAIF